MKKIRQDHELPQSIAEWGWKYHHLGVPTDKVMPNETYLEKFKLYVSGFTTSPYGIEWMRYEEGSPVDQRIQSTPHIAFEVADLEYELAIRDLKVITPPNSPSGGTRVAMVEHNGAIIELIEFKKNK
jgi:hypothetical protein